MCFVVQRIVDTATRPDLFYQSHTLDPVTHTLETNTEVQFLERLAFFPMEQSVCCFVCGCVCVYVLAKALAEVFLLMKHTLFFRVWYNKLVLSCLQVPIQVTERTTKRSTVHSITANLSYQTDRAGCAGMLRAAKITTLVQMSCFEELHQQHETFHCAQVWETLNERNIIEGNPSKHWDN